MRSGPSRTLPTSGVLLLGLALGACGAETSAPGQSASAAPETSLPSGRDGPSRFALDRLDDLAAVRNWFAAAREPRFDRPYSEMIHAPMLELEADLSGDRPAVRRLAEVDHVNSGPGKIVGIEKAIGRRPVIAVGNSDGDLQMLQWSAERPGPSLQVLIHHTEYEALRCPTSSPS